MIPALISAGAGILGGLIKDNSQDKANAINQQNALRQEALQREFAQTGIQWKAEDARKAGIHPLYALGASTHSYAPTTVGAVASDGLASGLASAGQDISRAVQSTRTADQRIDAFTKTSQDLTLQKMGLENQLLASQIAKMNGIGPAMPALTDKNPLEGQGDSKRPAIKLPHGLTLIPNKNETAAQTMSDEYGEISDLVGAFRLLKDSGIGLGNYLVDKMGGPGYVERGKRTMDRNLSNFSSARGRDEAFRRSRPSRW